MLKNHLDEKLLLTYIELFTNSLRVINTSFILQTGIYHQLLDYKSLP